MGLGSTIWRRARREITTTTRRTTAVSACSIEAQRDEITDLVFSPSGLNVDLIKMFLDPWHQRNPDGSFDHTKSTRNMLEFVEAGFATSEKKLQVITTLYGPPAWATKQKFVGGRDFDPKMSDKLANYMIDWALFLRDRYPLESRSRVPTTPSFKPTERD